MMPGDDAARVWRFHLPVGPVREQSGFNLPVHPGSLDPVGFNLGMWVMWVMWVLFRIPKNNNKII